MAEHDPEQNIRENRPGMDMDNKNEIGMVLVYSEIKPWQ